MAAQAAGEDRGSLLAVIGDEVLARDDLRVRTPLFYQCGRMSGDVRVVCAQDTVTGFLLAGVGNVDLRRKSNFLVVTESKLHSA